MHNKNMKTGPTGWPGVALFFLILLVVTWSSSPALAASGQNAVFFTDLQGHWAQSQITRLATLAVVKGYPDHT